MQEVEQFSREKEELEKDRLRMHAENDALQNKLEEMERQQEHQFIQGTMKLKKEYEQKMEELTKRYQSLASCALASIFHTNRFEIIVLGTSNRQTPLAPSAVSKLYSLPFSHTLRVLDDISFLITGA